MNAEFAKAVAEQARKELRDEQFRAAVEKEKLRIKTKRSLLDRLFPYTIHIVRKA